MPEYGSRFDRKHWIQRKVQKEGSFQAQVNLSLSKVCCTAFKFQSNLFSPELFEIKPGLNLWRHEIRFLFFFAQDQVIRVFFVSNVWKKEEKLLEVEKPGSWRSFIFFFFLEDEKSNFLDHGSTTSQWDLRSLKGKKLSKPESLREERLHQTWPNEAPSDVNTLLEGSTYPR